MSIEKDGFLRILKHSTDKQRAFLLFDNADLKNMIDILKNKMVSEEEVLILRNILLGENKK